MSVTTTDDDQARGVRCAALEKECEELIADGRMTTWQLAEKLYEFDEESGWTALGWDSLAEWLAQPTIGMQTATYYGMVRNWRTLVVHKKISSTRVEKLDWTKVRVVLPAIEEGRAPLKEILSDVEVLSRSHLVDKYIRPRLAPPPMGLDEPPKPGMDEPEPEDESEPDRSDEPDEDESDDVVTGQVVDHEDDEALSVVVDLLRSLEEAQLAGARAPRLAPELNLGLAIGGIRLLFDLAGLVIES